MGVTLTVGELEKRLVIDPPRTYHKLWQEIQDLLKLANDDFPRYEDIMERRRERGRRGERGFNTQLQFKIEAEGWRNKWLGNLCSIETKKIVLEVTEAEVREQYDSMRVVFPEGSKFGVVNKQLDEVPDFAVQGEGRNE